MYLLLGFTSAALALFLTPLIGRGSTVLGLVDAPGGRKVHAQSVPRLGGVAVVAESAARIEKAWRASSPAEPRTKSVLLITCGKVRGSGFSAK